MWAILIGFHGGSVARTRMAIAVVGRMRTRSPYALVLHELFEADLLQMEASFGPRLPPAATFFKPDGSPSAGAAVYNASAPRRGPTSVEFSFIETHLSRDLCRNRHRGTHHAVDVAGGGRSSAIIRRMSAKR